MTLSGASATVDVVASNLVSSTNWTPTISYVTPDYDTNGAVQLTPFVQSSLQLKITVFGQTIQNNLALNTQMTIGQSGGLVTLAQAGLSACPAGEFQTVDYHNVANTISFSGNSHNLYSDQGSSVPVCSSVVVDPPSASQVSALSAAVNGPAFCTSLLSYSPSTTTVTTTSTLTIATTTATVVGSGTTTITPDAVTATTTISASVSTYPGMKKRSEPTSASVTQETAAARVLLPRRFVPTPAVLKNWVPQQVSEACSQIATGLATSTVTATVSTSSGVTTATIQGTATAAAPTTYVSTTTYVPASAPTDLLANSGFWNWNLTGNMGVNSRNTPGEYIAYNEEVPAQYTYFLTGGATYVLTDLEVGWTYEFSLGTAAFHATTNGCQVFYYLDDYVMHSYTAADNGWTGTFANIPPTVPDGPYLAQPTAATQTLTVSVACAGPTMDAAFENPKFYGPLDE